MHGVMMRRPSMKSVATLGSIRSRHITDPLLRQNGSRCLEYFQQQLLLLDGDGEG